MISSFCDESAEDASHESRHETIDRENNSLCTLYNVVIGRNCSALYWRDWCLGFSFFSLELGIFPNNGVLCFCKIWVLLSTSGGTDRHVSLLNLRRSDEGSDVPWNGNPAQIIIRLSVHQDALRLNTAA